MPASFGMFHSFKAQASLPTRAIRLLLVPWVSWSCDRSAAVPVAGENRQCNYTVGMASAVRFEWDPGKATGNIRRHGVSFEEASTVFVDENAILINDPDHSADEDRFILLGLGSSLRVLIVCHCFRAESQMIRIISARKADRQERRDYFGRFNA
jgi:uncharacterized DUF497 family protein